LQWTYARIVEPQPFSSSLTLTPSSIPVRSDWLTAVVEVEKVHPGSRRADEGAACAAVANENVPATVVAKSRPP
jgi:hypothetical protein